MLFFSSRKSNIYALQVLLGVIVGVLVLFLMIKIFSEAFLTGDENLEIAKANAQSLRDFVEYSSSHSLYTDSDCFFTFKLKNLELFQYDEDGDFYFYVILPDGVYILHNDDYDTLVDSGKFDVKGLAKDKYYFSKAILLRKDKTEGGYFFGTVDLDPLGLGFTSILLGEKGTVIELADLEHEAYILYPMFRGLNTNTLFSGENKYFEGRVYDDGILKKTEDLDGSSFVFSNSYRGIGNVAFMASSASSDVLIDSQLCSKEHFEELDNDAFFKKKDNVPIFDFVNYDLFFTCKENSQYKFEWTGNEVCKQDDTVVRCDELFKDLTANVVDCDYKKFVALADEYCAKHNGESLTLLDKKKLSFKESSSKYSSGVPFSCVFTKRDDSFQKDKTETYLESSLVFYDFGKALNGCSGSDLCERILPEGGRALFYAKDNSNVNILDYYSFNQRFFRVMNNGKGQLSLYFLGKELSLDRENLDSSKTGCENEDGLSWIWCLGTFDDNIDYFHVEVPGIVGRDLYDVFLSRAQFVGVPTEDIEYSDLSDSSIFIPLSVERREAIRSQRAFTLSSAVNGNFELFLEYDNVPYFYVDSESNAGYYGLNKEKFLVSPSSEFGKFEIYFKGKSYPLVEVGVREDGKKFYKAILDNVVVDSGKEARSLEVLLAADYVLRSSDFKLVLTENSDSVFNLVSGEVHLGEKVVTFKDVKQYFTLKKEKDVDLNSVYSLSFNGISYPQQLSYLKASLLKYSGETAIGGAPDLETNYVLLNIVSLVDASLAQPVYVKLDDAEVRKLLGDELSSSQNDFKLEVANFAALDSLLSAVSGETYQGKQVVKFTDIRNYFTMTQIRDSGVLNVYSLSFNGVSYPQTFEYVSAMVSRANLDGSVMVPVDVDVNYVSLTLVFADSSSSQEVYVKLDKEALYALLYGGAQ
ncbi:hypothetical protein H6501_05030 [Candidatus Woesearchaeota archaeon]|nr:hypothetical protein [Candidatus Woesearchaeota archaeon]USN44038.1 MAG: hypothetical protein H6500_06640 [Candidatus Woesearchaeota archaeon]